MADQQLATQEVNKPKLSDLRVSPGQGIVIETVRDVHNFSVFAAAQGLVPSSFKDRGGNWNTGAITIALIKGLELGMKPTQALQSIYVVNNQPAIWGDAVPGLALASGQLEDWQEWTEGTPFEDDFTVVCSVKRRGLKSAYVERFSVADAKQGNVWGKSGPWSNWPRRMMTWRARFAFRSAFADVMKGLGIVEELQDIEPAVVEEPEYTSRQEEMLAGLRGGGQEETAEPRPARPPEPADDEPQDAEWTEPTPEEVEEIRAREMQEAGLFDQEQG